MLRVDQLSAGYGRMTAVREISLAVRPGEMLLIIGPNGAGKSTLLSSISGLLRPQDGSVTFAGDDITSWSVERTARAGLRHIMEGHRVFPELTVEENLRLGQLALAPKRRRAEAEVFDAAFEVFPVLGQKRREPARSLSGGQQQMLALVQAVVSEPQAILCDEPSLGMARALVPGILTYLRGVADSGVAVVLVEQLVELPLQFVDQVVVLRQGEIRAQGRADEFRPGGELAQFASGEA
jgi:branched-chain amino acid transport system ATP-binding protein